MSISVTWLVRRSWSYMGNGASTYGGRQCDLVADAGLSGTLADRPALAEALILLREGKAQCLVVHRPRPPCHLVVQEQLLAEVWRMGATVSSTAVDADAYLSDDPGDPSRG